MFWVFHNIYITMFVIRNKETIFSTSKCRPSIVHKSYHIPKKNNECRCFDLLSLKMHHLNHATVIYVIYTRIHLWARICSMQIPFKLGIRTGMAGLEDRAPVCTFNFSTFNSCSPRSLSRSYHWKVPLTWPMRSIILKTSQTGMLP